LTARRARGKCSWRCDSSLGEELLSDEAVPGRRPRALISKRNTGPEWDENIKRSLSSPKAPFHSREEIAKAPGFDNVRRSAQVRLTRPTDLKLYFEHLMAREELMFNVLKVMADNQIEAIVYKSIEHHPVLITEGLAGGGSGGIPTMSTFLAFVPTIAVPAGFTKDGLPIGMTFQGRPYGDGTIIKLAYAYEQATRHRRPPTTTPELRPGS
jgi:hypothetical protein